MTDRLSPWQLIWLHQVYGKCCTYQDWHHSFNLCHLLVPASTAYVTFLTGPMQCLMPPDFTICNVMCMALNLPHITQLMVPLVKSTVLASITFSTHLMKACCLLWWKVVWNSFSIIKKLREFCSSYTCIQTEWVTYIYILKGMILNGHQVVGLKGLNLYWCTIMVLKYIKIRKIWMVLEGWVLKHFGCTRSWMKGEIQQIVCGNWI